MSYDKFDVYRASDNQLVGSISAADAPQAVYRLLGGDWGRSDYFALDEAGHAKVKAMAAERAEAALAIGLLGSPADKLGLEIGLDQLPPNSIFRRYRKDPK